MKPIRYKGNVEGLELLEFAKDQPEYETLPARRLDDGTVVSCWRPTFKERISLLFRGRLFLMQLTFNNPLQPVWIGTEDPIIQGPGDEG